MAVAQGSGTGGTTKKKPDDPYFDSDSPAGSNFKRSSGSTSKSNGFQNSQLDDPYFSNTSPAGSTMSSDKSTWRNTSSSSSWNAAPAGAQQREAGVSNWAGSPEGRESSFESQRERRSTGSTVRRDEAGGGGSSGFGNAAPERERYQGEMPTRDRTQELLTPNNTTVWEPTGTGENVPFTSPLWNWVADSASRGVGYAQQINDAAENSGWYRNTLEYAEELRPWYEDEKESGSSVWANTWGVLGPLTELTKNLTLGAAAGATLPAMPPEYAPIGYEIDPDEIRPPVNLGDVMVAAGTAMNQTTNVFSNNYVGPEFEFTADPEQWAENLSAVSRPVEFIQSQLSRPGAWWDIFTGSIQDARVINDKYNNLSPSDQYLVSPALTQLAFSSPARTEKALNEVLTRQGRIDALYAEAEAAQMSGNMLVASQKYLEASALENKTALDIAQENTDIAGTMVGLMVMPDLFDFIAGPAIGGAVGIARATPGKVKALLRAAESADQAADIATTALQGALAGVDDLAKVVDESGDLFRFWKGEKNPLRVLFENTRQTEAERVAANFVDTFAVALPQAKTADEAKVLIRTIFDGTLFEKNPDLGRNAFLDPKFLEDLPVIKFAQEHILNAKSLNDPEVFNPLIVLGEVEDIIWRSSRRLFGLDNPDLPLGATYARVQKADSGKYVVEMRNAAADLLDTSDEMAYKEAKALMKQRNKEIEEGLSKNPLTRIGDWHRSVLSTMYLNLAPRHWIRNAIAAYASMTVDDALNFTKLDDIAKHVTGVYGGGAPSAEFGTVFRGAMADALGTEAGSSSWLTFGFWNKKNPFVWLDKAGNKIWTGATEIPVGGGKAIPIGEEAFRIRIAYQGWNRFLQHGVDALKDDFASGLRDLGVMAEIADAYAGKFSELGRSVSRPELIKRMKEMLGANELGASLESIGIDHTMTSGQNRVALAQLIENSSPDDIAGFQQGLFNWLREATRTTREILDMVPPQPGRSIYTLAEQAEDTAEGITLIERAAAAAGLDVPEARRQAEALWTSVTGSENTAIQSIMDLIANDADEAATARSIVFVNKIHEAKRNIRATVDRLNRQAADSARKGQPHWEQTIAQVTELWQGFANDLQTWTDDINLSSVPTPRAATEAFGVGEIVRLKDGTEVAIKQVLTENDVTSYVVTPRAQQAAQAAPQAAEVAPTAAQAATPRVLALTQDDMPEGFVFKKNAPVTLPDGRTVRMQDTLDWDEGDTTLTGYLAEEMQVAQVTDDMIPQRFLDGAKKHKTMTLNDGRKVRVIGDLTDGEKRVGFIVEVLPTARPVQQAAQAAPAPTFVERTINAADIVPPAGTADSATLESRDILSRMSEKYLSFDPESNRAIREAGASRATNDEGWNNLIEAGREYLDQGFRDAILYFQRYRSVAFLDHIVSAERQISRTGALVALKVADLRDALKAGDITRAQFYEMSSQQWNEFFEYGHGLYRWATGAALRETLGDDAVNALAEIPSVHIPPLPDVNDIRRVASLVGRASDKGDRRLVNSINKHLNFGIKKLEDMTPDQRRAAMKYYVDEATANNVDLSKEWYRWRSPNTSNLTGFRDDADFDTIMWQLESSRLIGGNVQVPTYSDYAAYELSNNLEVVKRLWANRDKILTRNGNTLTNQQKAGVIRLLNNMGRKFDDVLYEAAKVGEEAAAFGMLNYRDRRNIDTALGMIFPFHYYFTRAPLNWARRIAQKPSIGYRAYLAENAVRQENERYDGPQRVTNSIPNPLQPLARNVLGDRLGGAVADKLPNRMYFSLEYAIPYAIQNDWIDPSTATNNVERTLLSALRFTPGIQPLYQMGTSLAFDLMSPRDESEYSRLSENEIGDIIPFARYGGYMYQGITGNQIPRQLGDVFDAGRIERVINNRIAAGEYDDIYIAGLARAQVENQKRGYPPIPEMQDPKVAAEINAIVKEATSLAGWERFANLATGYLTGFPGQNVEDIEREFNEFNRTYYDLGYSYENPMGSRAAQDAYLQEELSSGVPFGEARVPARSSTYGAQGPETPLGVQWVTKEFREERSAIYEEMGKATADFIFDSASQGKIPTGNDLYEFKQQYYNQIEELKKRYPSAEEYEKDFFMNTRGMNPWEAAQSDIESLLMVEPPGKPERPGENATAKQLDDYFAAMGEWNESRLNYIERVANIWVSNDDTAPSIEDAGDLGVNRVMGADPVRTRALVGRYAQELVDAYELRYASPVEIEWYMRNQMRSEVTGPAYAARREALTAEFGDDGYALFSRFDEIPEGEGNKYWTPAHDKFIEENPEVQGMLIYDRSPDVYQKMLSMGGERVFEALAMYPGGGSKSEKNSWKAKYGREKKAVYWYFGNNDELRSSVSAAYDAADELPYWKDYSGDRPIGSGREPIGGMSRQEYLESQPIFAPDYTGMRLEDAQAQQAIDATSKTAAFDYDYNKYLAAEYPPLAESMPQGLPKYVTGIPGVNADPAMNAAEMQAAQTAAGGGKLLQYIDMVKEIEANTTPKTRTASSGGGGGGYRGYYYRGRYYSRRSSRGRRGGRRGGYRRYSRGGGGRRYGGYGGGGGGSTVDEGQELFLNTNNPPRIYAREFASWLMPSSSSRDVWRPTGASTGMRQPQQPSIRPWRRINVRA